MINGGERALPFAPAPPGATLPGFTSQKPAGNTEAAVFTRCKIKLGFSRGVLVGSRLVSHRTGRRTGIYRQQRTRSARHIGMI